MTSETINDNQEEAFDKLIELGGEEQWIDASKLGHWNTVRALARRRVIQIHEHRGKEYAAVAGVLLDPPETVSASVTEEVPDGSDGV